MPEYTRRERLREFVRRLKDRPATSSEEEALEQIEEMLNGVENEMTSIPFNPATRGDDGRM